MEPGIHGAGDGLLGLPYDLETLATLSPGWVLLLLGRNALAVLIFFGAMELRLYVLRKQGNQFKYNHRWPSENKSDVFMFKSQTIDGAIRTFTTGVPIWTAYEVMILWCYANGIGAWSSLVSVRGAGVISSPSAV